MNTGILVVVALLFTLILLALQRTEFKRIWVTLLVLVVPAGYLIYQWADYKGYLTETKIAAGIAVALNVIFWIVWGRRHLPGEGGTIKVIGQEDPR